MFTGIKLDQNWIDDDDGDSKEIKLLNANKCNYQRIETLINATYQRKHGSNKYIVYSNFIFYNIEDKITWCWLDHEGGLFFFNWGQSYLAFIGRWFAKYVFLATMALRFAEVDENGIIDLMFCSLFFMAKFSCLKAVE